MYLQIYYFPEQYFLRAYLFNTFTASRGADVSFHMCPKAQWKISMTFLFYVLIKFVFVCSISYITIVVIFIIILCNNKY